MKYKLVFYSYCGMSTDLAQGERDELRSMVAARILNHRKTGRPVYIIKEGYAWELGESDDGAMVSDDEGRLWLRPVGGGGDDTACQL